MADSDDKLTSEQGKRFEELKDREDKIEEQAREAAEKSNERSRFGLIPSNFTIKKGATSQAAPFLFRPGRFLVENGLLAAAYAE